MSDVWSRIENAQERTYQNFGQFNITPEEVVLIKGVGRQPYDPAQHQPGQRRDNININITPVPAQDQGWEYQRNMLASDKGWVQMVLPSIRKFSESPQSINGKWVQYESKPTGRKWVGRDGVEREADVPVIVAVFPSQAAAEAAAEVTMGGAPAQAAAQPQVDLAAQQRTMAANFLPIIWQNAGKDPVKFMEAVKANPATAMFELADAEIVAVMAGS